MLLAEHRSPYSRHRLKGCSSANSQSHRRRHPGRPHKKFYRPKRPNATRRPAFASLSGKRPADKLQGESLIRCLARCQVTFQSDKFGATENNILSVVCVTIHCEVKKASFALTFAGRGCGDPIRGRERIGIPLNVIGAQVAWSVGGLVFYLH